MLEILFGPDGVGKSTVAKNMLTNDPSLTVLHGTNIRSWFRSHGELLSTRGLTETDIPPDTDFKAKISLLNMAAIALTATGMGVVIDGHSLHKTMINVAAGRVEIKDAAYGSSIDKMLGGPLGRYLDQLSGSSTIHTHVVLPDDLSGDEAAAELQRRLETRGEPTEWDPSSAAESLAQLTASYQLETNLRQRDAQVTRVISQIDT